tara:strand:- start:81 stop:566 length:486 start_codon:yes stop_codon:yes gene_type:complete
MKIIKNFCKQDLFNELVNEIIVTGNTPFFFNTSVAYKEDKKTKTDFYFTHTVYEQQKPNSQLYDKFIPILEKLEVKSLIRIKINLYPRTEKLHYHNKHKDWDFKHKGCIIGLNDCNGFTIIKDKKIPSVANQALLFDPSVEHNSTTCTDQQARFNINFNYF